MKIRLLISLVLIAFCSLSALAQQKFSANAILEVRYDNQMVRSEMYSYIARELRSLGDVAMVTKKEPGTFTLSVMMVPTKMGDQLAGYAVSVTITRFMRCNTMYKNPDNTIMVASYDNWDNSFIFVGGPDDLKSIGQKIVAAFDSNSIEPQRDVFKLSHPKKT